ncbi:MAG: hypothetical protein ACTSP6_09755 [Promethearchaeota archaeon]
MPTKSGEEDDLRKKVWKVINLIQANQLFVHSKNLNIKFLNEKNKIETKILPEILSLCVLNAFLMKLKIL